MPDLSALQILAGIALLILLGAILVIAFGARVHGAEPAAPAEPDELDPPLPSGRGPAGLFREWPERGGR